MKYIQSVFHDKSLFSKDKEFRDSEGRAFSPLHPALDFLSHIRVLPFSNSTELTALRRQIGNTASSGERRVKEKNYNTGDPVVKVTGPYKD